ncbi:unnamed protein product, partial [Ectocarpus sp. 12 AP-2014]
GDLRSRLHDEEAAALSRLPPSHALPATLLLLQTATKNAVTAHARVIGKKRVLPWFTRRGVCTHAKLLLLSTLQVCRYGGWNPPLPPSKSLEVKITILQGKNEVRKGQQ